jgi:hypothetical protein
MDDLVGKVLIDGKIKTQEVSRYIGNHKDRHIACHHHVEIRVFELSAHKFNYGTG